MVVLLLLAALFSSNAESRFPFTTSESAEVVAHVEMSSPGADWAKRGQEAAVADVLLDGKPHQQVILYAGPSAYPYRLSLGRLEPGQHEIRVQRSEKFSAAGAALQAHGLRVEEIAPGHPDFDAYASAPVLFARLNTVGRFSDIPLLLYCEKLEEDNGKSLQYTVIFSNEDGGTSTRTLMARWGRSTDIEYVYRRSAAAGRAIVQGPGHKDIEFTGEREGAHPMLMPVTDNNMIAEAKDSPLGFRLAPLIVDLSKSSREEIMDRHPVTYAVMAKELEREGKLRPFGVVAGENISDPRNYLYVDYSAKLASAALTVSVVTRDGQLYTSDLGRADVAIARNGHVRTTVELPPGTTRETIATISFECRVPPPARGEATAHSGVCELQGVSKVFFLERDYMPGKSFWSLTRPVTLATGRGVSFRP